MVGADDRARVRAAIVAAERTTSGEFVCVLARNASRYDFYPLLWAGALALATPWLLVALTPWSVQRILLAQLAVFAAAMLPLSTAPVRTWIVPRRVKRAAAHRAAAEQFLIRGLAHTPHRRGVLLYVALDEHYARVLADDGAAGAVPADYWLETVRLLIGHAREGRHADGFVAALAHAAEGLKRAFPASPPGDKVLPDRFYVLD